MKQRKLFSTRKLVYTAVLSALAILITLINVPIGLNGYGNVGDSIIFLAAYILGPLGGLIVGAMTFLADIILGYTMYAPATLIVKGLEGFILGVGFVFLKKLDNKKLEMALAIVVTMFAGAIMMTGYFITDLILTKTLATATLGLIPNIIQASISAVISFVLIYVINVPKLVPASKNITRYKKSDENEEKDNENIIE